MLVADDIAQSKAHEIVGLDFDPILFSQDPSSKFVVEKVSAAGGSCNADVVGIERGVREERLTPELIRSSGRWIFVNFHYQYKTNGKLENSDLVGILKDLQMQRSR